MLVLVRELVEALHIGGGIGGGSGGGSGGGNRDDGGNASYGGIRISRSTWQWWQ